MGEKKIPLKFEKIIRQMTLSEKASLMSGANFWNTKSVDRLGIPSIMLTDGPHGLRKQGGKEDHLGLNKSIPATCFPTAAALANSWDTSLLEDVGRCLGKEAYAEKVSVLLGPGLNIKRNPLAGRNFEYFSEDPYLTGKLAAALTRGIQKEGVAACPKHYAVNSQETRRMQVDERVDERALREIYLEGFRRVVQEAKPLTIMTAYNKVNGEYANENTRLLKDILIGEWGFSGTVISDWGGNHDRVAALTAGSTLEMPSAGGMTDKEIEEAVAKGLIDESVLDEQVDKLLTLIEQTGYQGFGSSPKRELVPDKSTLHEENHKIAVKAACKSLVLLKNDGNLLPITDRNKKVAIIGDFAETPRYQGAGSSLVRPTRLVSFLDAVKNTDLNVIGYEKGYKRFGGKSKRLMKKALDLARKADIVILYPGLDENSESEGWDRKNMRLSDNQLALAEALISFHRQVVVVLACGAPVEMPFASKVPVILHGYLSGQGGGEALARTITGENNPSGKLAETYPLRYSDVASSPYFPGEILTSEHRESIFVGYRQYDYEEKEVLFPFGHGLSYTTFRYENLSVNGNKVTVTLRNTGPCFGEEIVQLYVSSLQPKVFREKKALKGFAKVALLPGEAKQVDIFLDEYAFSYYHVKLGRFVTESGKYEIGVGASSRDIRLKTVVTVKGETVENPYEGLENTPYVTGESLAGLTTEDFERLLGEKLPSSLPEKGKQLDADDLIEQARYYGLFGKMLYGLLIFSHKILKLLGKKIAADNVMFLLSLPFRNIATMSGGIIDKNQLEGLLTMINGRFFKGLKQIIRKKK
jgi:beta-glucosidase